MKNFKEIAEKCLAGELSGTFILHNGEKKHVSKKNQTIHKDYLDPYSPYIIGNRKYSRCGVILPISNAENPYDIIDFIPDNMQKKIKIDIPEGKVPVMEQTENGVVITWKKKEVTYDEIYEYLHKNKVAINYYVTKGVINNENESFLNKMNILRKLTNIRNYFGKPDENEKGWIIEQGGIRRTMFESKYNCNVVVFTKKEHAEQAIKMLGDELKYLFEPW